MEEAEVKIDLADMVMEQLVSESVDVAIGIEKKRSNKS